MSDDLREQVTEVLYDFRDGLLDDVDQGVDRILELMDAEPPPAKIPEWDGTIGPGKLCGAPKLEDPTT